MAYLPQPMQSDREDPRQGFTLIELLIVILISAMLSAIVITYSGVGRDEVGLSVESTAVAQTILRAKSLAVTTYAASDASAHACGYGVVFDAAANTYSVIAYDRPIGLSQCPSESSLMNNGIPGNDIVEYAQNEWQIPFADGISLDAPPGATSSLQLVLFYPPDPTTFISLSSCTPGSGLCDYTFVNQPAFVRLKAADGGATQAITVDTEGQVTF